MDSTIAALSLAPATDPGDESEIEQSKGSDYETFVGDDKRQLAHRVFTKEFTYR